MTISTLISKLAAEKPHQYANDVLLTWLNSLERDICDYMNRFGRRYVFTDKTLTDTLYIEDPLVYITYLSAMIDRANNETERYNDNMLQFNQALHEWKCSYIQKHHPKRTGGKIVL